MPDASNPLKRQVPSASATMTRGVPKWSGFPDKLKRIDPGLEQSERELKAVIQALEEKLNAAINAQKHST